MLHLLSMQTNPSISLQTNKYTQAFNVAAMLLVRSQGAVATGLTMSCLVPITVAAFTLPLPFLQQTPLGPYFMVGTGLLMLGLVLFNAHVWGPVAAALRQMLDGRWATNLAG